jgi:hypothetical protein
LSRQEILNLALTAGGSTAGYPSPQSTMEPMHMAPMDRAELRTDWTQRTRWLLLGPEDAWGARLATSPAAIYVLATFALIVHSLDLATGVHMMMNYGVHLEINPLARVVMASAGPVGLVVLKVGVVSASVRLFVRFAQVGRPRLARNCLLFAVGVGVLGFASNMV